MKNEYNNYTKEGNTRARRKRSKNLSTVSGFCRRYFNFGYSFLIYAFLRQLGFFFRYKQNTTHNIKRACTFTRERSCFSPLLFGIGNLEYRLRICSSLISYIHMYTGTRESFFGEKWIVNERRKERRYQRRVRGWRCGVDDQAYMEGKGFIGAVAREISCSYFC